MAYVVVKEENQEKLHLSRDPSIRSWAILFGICAVGMGAAMFSVDYLLWKLAYISGAIFVGLSCMEDWEECILDKSTKKVSIKKQSLIQKVFQTQEGQRMVVANLEDIVGVKVKEEEVKYGQNGYVIMLNFNAGFSVAITETASIGNRKELELMSKKISEFLQLQEKVFGSPLDEAPEGMIHEDSSSNESFEEIDRNELPKEAEDSGDQ